MGIKTNLDFLSLIKDWEEVHASGQWVEGKFALALEEKVEAWSGLNAVTVNSAGSGLFLLAREKWAGYSSEVKLKKPIVYVAANTFYATGAMFQAAGFHVRLVDCNREDFSMSAEHLQHLFDEYIDQPVAGVVLTHVGGQLARDAENIASLCSSYGRWLIEDAAHAFGVQDSQGRVAGSFGDAAVFSLYPTKSLPAGEGGIIVSSQAELTSTMRLRKSYNKHLMDGAIEYTKPTMGYGPWPEGFNFRMDEWTAVVALKQFERRDEILASREDQAAKLIKAIGSPMIHWASDRDLLPSPQTNWYKFPIPKWRAKHLKIKRFAGPIYQTSDQLHVAMNLNPGYLPNSTWVAKNHVCIPLEEGLYDNMTPQQVLDWLRSEP